MRQSREAGCAVSTDRASIHEETNWSDWVRQRIARATPGVKRRALLVSYQFPPVGGSGVQRPAKLVKYLRQFGWDVEVLAAAHDRFPWHDPTLLKDLPTDCVVHRAPGYEPACIARRAASCVDFGNPKARKWVEDRLYWRMAGWAARHGRGNGEAWWVRPATLAAKALHAKRPYDAVISSGPPHFVHQVAQRFASAARIAWLADLRDPLVSDFDRTPAAQRQQHIGQRLEQLVMRHADGVITTCEAFARDLSARYPHRAPYIACIANGFDRDDLAPHVDYAGETAQSTCRFIASGSFYGRRELRRVIDPLRNILAQHPEWAGRVELQLVGTIDAEQREWLAGFQHDWLTMTPYIAHADAIRAALQATCSIVLVPDCQHGQMSIPAKVFEAIALPRHVLGLVPPGSETERILQKAGACTTAALEDEPQIVAAVRGIITRHFDGTLTSARRWTTLEAYDRRTIAQRFAACLAAAVQGDPLTDITTSDTQDAGLSLSRGASSDVPTQTVVPSQAELVEVR